MTADHQHLLYTDVTAVLCAQTISLGTFTIPHAISSMGLVPGVFFLICVALAAAFGASTMDAYKRRYADVEDLSDALEQMFGASGRWTGEICQFVYLVFLMAAHISAFAMRVRHVAGLEVRVCPIVWAALATLCGWLFTIQRRLKAAAHAAVGACLTILVACLIAVWRIHSSPHSTGPDTAQAFVSPLLTSPASVTQGLSCMIMVFISHIIYFEMKSEMRCPKQFKTAACSQLGITLGLYLVVGCVIYGFAGADVDPLALGSLSKRWSKVAYVIAFPSILVSAGINAHAAARSIYSLFWKPRKNAEVTIETRWRAWGSWVTIITSVWGLGFVFSQTLPQPHLMLGLVGALFGPWIITGIPCLLWLAIDWSHGLIAGDLEMNRAGSVVSVDSQEPSKMPVMTCAEPPGLSETQSTAALMPWSWAERIASNRAARPKMFFLVAFLLLSCPLWSGLGLYGNVRGFLDAAGGSHPFQC